jgi:iron complex outermembrane receptor protein
MRDFLATTATLALVVATPAFAQDTSGTSPEAAAPAPQKADETPKREGDIIVTARRREESIRDVPGTITAVTNDQLEGKGPVAGTGDLLNTIPGVRFNDVASENLAEVSIRGSGTARATGADSGVGLFVNGAYVGSSTLGGRNFKTNDYFDIERVESLEGPQGALYGRNSEFGVINIVLAKPKFDSSGYIRDTFTFGLEQNRVSMVVNEALSDTVAIRVGGEGYTQTAGFYYDPDHDKYYDSTKGWNGRGQIRYRSGGLDMTFLIDGQDLNLPSFVNSLVIPGGGVNPSVPLGFTQSRFVIPHSGDDGLQQRSLRGMLLTSYTFGGGVTLEATTMATKWHSSQQYASAVDLNTAISMRQQGEIGIYPFTQVHTDVKDRTFYQDLHLRGSAAGGQLSWVVGGEFLAQHDDYALIINQSPCAYLLTNSICTGTLTAPVCIKPLPTSTNCPAVPALIYGTDSRTKQDIASFAGYASLQYTIGKFSVVGEGRFSHDDKKATQGVTALYTTTYTKVPTTFTFKSSQPAWTFTASYKFGGANSTLLYAKVGTGYRAGGVNNGAFNAAAPNPFVFVYGNENTIGYETGVKTSLIPHTFLRLSAYMSRTTDAITSINDGCTLTNACATAGQQFNINGGTIHARGLEAALDGRFRVTGGLFSFGLNAATQRAFFAKVPTGISGLPVPNSAVAQIPDWTMSASLDYRHPLFKNTVGFLNMNYSGQRDGIQDTVTTATPAIQMSNFDIFGAQAGLKIGSAQIAVFVRNFTDEQVQVLKFTQANFPLSVRYNKPKTIGLTVGYRW